VRERPPIEKHDLAQGRLLIELGQELADAAFDLVADLSDALERFVLGIGKLPGDVALAC